MAVTREPNRIIVSVIRTFLRYEWPFEILWYFFRSNRIEEINSLFRTWGNSAKNSRPRPSLKASPGTFLPTIGSTNDRNSQKMMILCPLLTIVFLSFMHLLVMMEEISRWTETFLLGCWRKLHSPLSGTRLQEDTGGCSMSHRLFHTAQL